MSKWYWLMEFAGNAVGTLSLGIFTFLFSGIALVGSATFGSVFGELWVLYLIALFSLLRAERLSDDWLRLLKNNEKHGDWYWPLEFTGHVVAVLGLFWMIMVHATVQAQGHHVFNEPNSWILWSEIPVLAAMWLANALNWFNDIRRFREGGNS